jgi:serine/threonine-protein kinase RsbW
MVGLVLPGTLESLDDVADFVLRTASRTGLDGRRTYRLRLAADEIATNIVTHGYAGREGVLHVTACVDERALSVTLEDCGVPFDPLKYENDLQIDAPLADRREGGLGLYLAIRAVDQFRYEFENGRNRNILTMLLCNEAS